VPLSFRSKVEDDSVGVDEGVGEDIPVDGKSDYKEPLHNSESPCRRKSANPQELYLEPPSDEDFVDWSFRRPIAPRFTYLDVLILFRGVGLLRDSSYLSVDQVEHHEVHCKRRRDVLNVLVLNLLTLVIVSSSSLTTFRTMSPCSSPRTIHALSRHQSCTVATWPSLMRPPAIATWPALPPLYRPAATGIVLRWQLFPATSEFVESLATQGGELRSSSLATLHFSSKHLASQRDIYFRKKPLRRRRRSRVLQRH
jgi:hypothetical protein